MPAQKHPDEPVNFFRLSRVMFGVVACGSLAFAWPIPRALAREPAPRVAVVGQSSAQAPPAAAPSESDAAGETSGGFLPGVKKMLQGVREIFSGKVDDPQKVGGEFVRSHSQTLVLVSDGGISGSGFLGRMNGRTFLFTNAHVAAGTKRPRFTLLDGTVLTPTTVEGAVDHDIIRFGLKDPPPEALEIESDVSGRMAIGDDIFVFGNTGGGGVVTNLPGTVKGLGPDRVEVSAQFVPGDSGSPIVHAKSGRVIAIATYLTKRYDEFSSGAAGPSGRGVGGAAVRRFGYRLDSVQTWQPIHWPQFVTEAGQIEKISAVTQDILQFFRNMHGRRAPQCATDTLRRPATEWFNRISRPQTSESDQIAATQSFLSTLRFVVKRDLADAANTIRYDYFQRELRKEQDARDRLYKALDEDLRALRRF